MVGIWNLSKKFLMKFSFYICVNTFCECLLIILRVYEIWTYLLMNIFSIALFKINFFYQYLLNIIRIKFRSFLKKDIVYNIFENCNFRFDEWFSKKSYIDIYFFMSGLIFDFTVEHKIYIFGSILSVYLMILMWTMIIVIFVN